MKIKRLLAFAMAAVLCFSLVGCMNRGNDDSESKPEVTPEDELVIYHNSTELAPMLMSLAEEYSSATGKKITAKLAGNDFFGEMKDSGGAIYIVDTHSDLSDWHSEGMFADFMNDTGLSSLFSGIPAGLQLNQSGLGSYGIPLMLEGYGFIFDKDMLGDLFGTENAEAVADALKTCSFTEFEGFVAAVDSYIASPSAAKITLGGSEYTFAPEKTGKAANLTGVFSLNNESTRAIEHLLSTALAAKFGSRYEVMSASEEAVSEMEDIISAFAEALDLWTSHIAGAEGSISRGEEFTGGDYNYSTSIDLFTRGNALFYAGGTSDASDFEKSSEGFGKNLDIIPMKLPVDSDDVTASGMTAEKLQSSIVIGSRYYIALNPNASEGLASAAREFISWIYGDEAGKGAYSNSFGTVPHNFEYYADESGNRTDDSGAETPMGGETSAPEGKSSSRGGIYGDGTKSGTVSPENASPSGTGEKDQAGAENENSGISAEGNASSGSGNSSGGTSSGSGNSSENGTSSEEGTSGGGEQNPMQGGMNGQSHEVSSTLLGSVAEYYASGNWIPDMTFALPSDFAEKILGGALSDYWGMETWSDENRENFVDTIIGGWKERLDKDKTAVG